MLSNSSFYLKYLYMPATGQPNRQELDKLIVSRGSLFTPAIKEADRQEIVHNIWRHPQTQSRQYVGQNSSRNAATQEGR